MLKHFARTAVLAGIIPPLIYVGLTLAMRTGQIGFGDVMGAFSWLKPVLMVGAALAVLGGVLNLFQKKPFGAILGVAAAAACLVVAAVPGGIRETAQSVPPIHDISTDTETPPQFDVTAAERTEGENPAAYDPGQTAQQKEAYPDIVPITVEASPSAAYDAAVAAMNAEGIAIKAARPDALTVEGTATTPWFGFEDDVIIRITAGEGGGSVIDIRSKSRVGRSDLGKNAERVRALRDRIVDTLS